VNPIIEKTKIDGCLIIKNIPFADDRGYFNVPFNLEFYQKLLPEITFVQDNQSYSKYGVVRGLHYQKYPYEQSKLVRCSYGMVRDVIVDLRMESITYGEVVSVDLSGENAVMVFIPKGCAHGFSVLSTEAVFEYKVDAPYNKDADSGIVWDDATLDIDWGILSKNVIVSDKDKVLPKFFKR
jgi:dTDP-4-dehydrorhamnose 3,5-epimerase